MKRSPRLVFYVLIGLLLALDQITKDAIRSAFGAEGPFGNGREAIAIIPGCFNLSFVRNTGIAFGFFAGNNFLWFGIALLFLILGGFVAWRLDWRPLEINLVGALLVSGALGNLLDRGLHGYVVDFLDFYWRSSHFPSFNVADSCITVSVAWILARNFFGTKTGDQAEIPPTI